MKLLPRFAPSTQMDALRTLLSQYREDDRGFPNQLEKSLLALGPLALPELGQVLARGAAGPGLRLCILQTAERLAWPDWAALLLTMLQSEEDLDLFDQGCAVLGGLCTGAALAGLRTLKKQRQDPERQAILDRELGSYQAEHPLESCLGALLEGERNPDLARLGARWLAADGSPERRDGLLQTFRDGDSLTRRLVLPLLVGLDAPMAEDPAAEPPLVLLFQEVLADLRDTRLLVDFIGQLEALPGRAQREELQTKLGLCFTSCTPELAAALRARIADPGHGRTPDLGPLEQECRGPLQGFLLKALGLLIQGKLLGFSSMVHEAHLDTIPALQQELQLRLDEIAALLAGQAETGRLPLAQVLALLEQAYHGDGTGDGLHLAYLRLMPLPDSGPQLENLLAEPRPERRKRIIETLGAREDDRLVPFFLKAMNDPVREVGQLAIHQLGKLPSGRQGMLDLFRSGELDRMREAVRFFAENHTQEAVKPLMGFLASEGADDLMADAATALGNIGDPAATNALLRQLHAGKPLALQLAIVEALTRLRTPEASMGLLKKSEELTLPDVLLNILQGTLAAFPGFEQPFPKDQSALLENLVDRGCDPREGAGHWLSVAALLGELYVFDFGLYDRLIGRFSAALVEMRRKPNFDRKSYDLVAEVVKKLSRRAAKLSTIEDRERALQAAIEGIPPAGAARMQVLHRVREALSDAEQVLGEASAEALVAFLNQEIAREGLDYAELELLCSIAALTGQRRMVASLEDLHVHGGSAGIRALARKTLLDLGLSEAEIDRRKPIRSILLLEPSAFFRQRLTPTLESETRTVAAAAGRQEAEAILAGGFIDLVISESHDGAGELWAWLETAWKRRAFRYLLLSTSDHEPGPLTGRSWLIGRLLKPYPPDRLVKVIAD